jgi:hypothetical protein
MRPSRIPRRQVSRLVLALALAAVSAVPPPVVRSALALATDHETVASTFTTDTLDPPSNLTCSGLVSCSVSFATKPTLTWTATPDTYASGYQVLRSTTSGSGYAVVATVTPRTTTTWTDNTVAALTTYYYVVRAVASSWTSALTNQVSASVLV